MNSLKSIFSIALLALCAFALSSCKDDPSPEPVVSVTFPNLAADPPTGFNPNTGAPIGTTNKFTFFSFKTGAIVDHVDSASGKWDLGFRATTIIVNGTTSGPGTSQAQIVSGVFDELKEAPLDGYKSDNDLHPVAAAPNANLAIPTGSGIGWYTASGGAPGTPTITKPIAGKIIVVKTSEGRYAKMEILSYYKDAPTNPTGTEPSRYYTFRYVYQPNDTRSFE